MGKVRVNKVRQLIKEVISEVIRKDVKDPRIQFVTITDVELTADLQLAKVYVSILGDNKVKEEAITALNTATPFIRSKLAERVNLRRIPVLSFELDTSFEKQDRLFKLLDEIKKGS